MTAQGEPGRAEDAEDLEPLERIDQAHAEDRIVSIVDRGHRRLVVRQGAEGEARQLPDRHPDDRHERQDDDLGHGEVDRSQQAPDGAPEPGGRVRLDGSRPGGPGEEERTGDRSLLDGRRGEAGDRAPLGAGRGPAARRRRGRSRSRDRSSASSSPTEHRRSWRDPALRRGRPSSSWRCSSRADAAIVKTPPSEAVSSAIDRASMNASPAARTAAISKASIPPPMVSCAAREGAADDWPARVEDPLDAVLALEPGAPAGRPVADSRSREWPGSICRQTRKPNGEPGPPPVDLERRDRIRSSLRPTTTPASTSLWPDR